MIYSLARDGAWGAAARDWADIQEAMFRPLFDWVLTETRVSPGTRVLDVACGTGLFCALAAQRGARVAGIDASAGQLAIAYERTPAGDFRTADIETLPFAAGTFDLVTCCNALQYANDPVHALREMRRVARPGATVGLVTRSQTGPHASETYFAALAPLRPPLPPDAPPMTVTRQPGALEAALSAADLTIEVDEERDCPWEYPDLETALRGVLSFAPAVRAIRASGADRVRTAVSAALAPYTTPDGGYRLPNRARCLLARAG